jgi:hypothetical protein
MAQFTLSAHSFRFLPTPLDSLGIRTHLCVVQVDHIPEEFEDWIEVNAREASLTGKVPKEIRTTLSEQPEYFGAFNRGLAVLASSVTYDNKAHLLTLEFSDKNQHGVLDGGHTLKVLLEQRSNRTHAPEDDSDAPHCRLEVMTGVPKEMITSLVEARNTSRQVASKSLLNLGGKLEGLKEALGPSITNLVSWRENEDGQIDVREVVALLTAFDATHYDDIHHPIMAYTGKEACLKHFEISPDCYQKLYLVAKDILRMWDEIQAVVPDGYNSEGGRFGGLKACEPLKKPRQLSIIGGQTRHPFPAGYLPPVVAAFRAMLVESNGSYKWGKAIDPSRLVRDGLATRIFTGAVAPSAKTYRNPNVTGKDAAVWGLAYQMAENAFLRL